MKHPVWFWPWLLFLFLVPFERAIADVRLGLPLNLLGLGAAALVMFFPHRGNPVRFRTIMAFALLVAANLSFWGSTDMAFTRSELTQLNIVALIYLFASTRAFTPLQLEGTMAAWMRGGGCLALLIIVSFLRGHEFLAGRATFIGDPNYLALELVMPFAMALFFIQRKQGWEGWLWSGLIVGATYLTQSRGGMLAIALAFVASMVLAHRWKSLALTACLVAGFLCFSPSLGRFDLASDPTGSGRTEIWKAAYTESLEHWPTGLGLGNFFKYTSRSGFLFLPQNVHNCYLQAFVEIGFPGLVALLLTMASHLMIRRKHALADPIRAGMLGIMLGACFLDLLNYKVLWLPWVVAAQVDALSEPST